LPSSTPTLAAVIKDLSSSIEHVPGLAVSFSQPIRDGVNESISGQLGPIPVKLYGDELVALQAQAKLVKRAFAKVKGVADLGIVKSGEVPNVEIALNRVALARYGMAQRLPPLRRSHRRDGEHRPSSAGGRIGSLGARAGRHAVPTGHEGELRQHVVDEAPAGLVLVLVVGQKPDRIVPALRLTTGDQQDAHASKQGERAAEALPWYPATDVEVGVEPRAAG